MGLIILLTYRHDGEKDLQMREITRYVESETYEIASLNSERKQKLKEVLDCETAYADGLSMDEYEAYTNICRTNHSFEEIVDKAYDFWKDYKYYLYKIPGTGKFAKKWLN